MPEVTVTPETFSMVEFDAAVIVSVAEKVLADVGYPAETTLRIDVDETSPLGRARVSDDGSPIVVEAESGVFEDPKRPRHMSEAGTADVLGRLLTRLHDRRDDAFGDPPADGDLTLAQSVAWDAYVHGRLARMGYRAQRQRRIYHFRNRHGFTDAADAAFEQLWTSDGLTWADVDRISSAALGADSTA